VALHIEVVVVLHFDAVGRNHDQIRDQARKLFHQRHHDGTICASNGVLARRVLLVVAEKNREIGLAQVGTNVGNDLCNAGREAWDVGGRQVFAVGDPQHNDDRPKGDVALELAGPAHEDGVVRP
jgi:hypothetical protein